MTELIKKLRENFENTARDVKWYSLSERYEEAANAAEHLISVYHRLKRLKHETDKA